MQNDVSPGILEAVKRAFVDNIANDERIQVFIRAADANNIGDPDVHNYSRFLGEALGKAFGREIKLSKLPDGRLYWNIAKSVIDPMIRQNHELVVGAGEIAEKIKLKKSGLLIGTVKPKVDEERLRGLLNSFTVEDLTEEELEVLMLDQTTNITEHFYDQYVRENAEFRYQCGVENVVFRTVGRDPCSWCIDKAGVYDYESVREPGNPVWQRHKCCHCEIKTEINGEVKTVPGPRTNRAKDKIRRL